MQTNPLQVEPFKLTAEEVAYVKSLRARFTGAKRIMDEYDRTIVKPYYKHLKRFLKV